ncbi:hypothetical protein H8959_010807 [Pygathrix nigripes]
MIALNPHTLKKTATPDYSDSAGWDWARKVTVIIDVMSFLKKKGKLFNLMEGEGKQQEKTSRILCKNKNNNSEMSVKDTVNYRSVRYIHHLAPFPLSVLHMGIACFQVFWNLHNGSLQKKEEQQLEPKKSTSPKKAAEPTVDLLGLDGPAVAPVTNGNTTVPPLND